MLIPSIARWNTEKSISKSKSPEGQLLAEVQLIDATHDQDSKFIDMGLPPNKVLQSNGR